MHPSSITYSDNLSPSPDLLAPLFFIVVGAKTDLNILNPANPSSAEDLLIASLLILVALVGSGG
jgi:Kef-type K+ transport system membrane component KefB